MKTQNDYNSLQAEVERLKMRVEQLTMENSKLSYKCGELMKEMGDCLVKLANAQSLLDHGMPYIEWLQTVEEQYRITGKNPLD